MELELGLGLSCSNVNSNFDLNNINGYDQMYGSSRSTNNDDRLRNKKKKRSFDDAFIDDSSVVPETLPLLVWNSMTTGAAAAAEESTNYYDDHVLVDDDHVDEASSIATHKNDGGDQGNVVIGWPPVKSWRKTLCHQKHGGGGGMKSGSIYVKVKMEGVGIARKVDLSQHGSYQALISTLIAMFGYENVKLTYQDKEGDWLLAGDVPWGTFVHTVQRLNLIKCGKE